MKNNFAQTPAVSNALNKYPIILIYNNKNHIKVFRDILEAAMSTGRWLGACYTDA